MTWLSNLRLVYGNGSWALVHENTDQPTPVVTQSCSSEENGVTTDQPTPVVTEETHVLECDVTTAVCPVCRWESESDDMVHCGCCDQTICTECYVDGGHLQNDPAPDADWAEVRGDTKAGKGARPCPPAVTTAVKDVVTQNSGGVAAPVTMRRQGLDELGQMVAAGSYSFPPELLNIKPDVSDYNGHDAGEVTDAIIDAFVVEIAQLRTQVRQLTKADERETRLGGRLLDINTAVGRLENRIAILADRIQAIDSQRCTGRPYERTLNSGTVVVYANHSKGDVCPVCGEHPEGGRLRKYIGEDETVPVQNIREAMRYQREWEDAKAELKRQNGILSHIDRIVWQMEAALR